MIKNISKKINCLIVTIGCTLFPSLAFADTAGDLGVQSHTASDIGKSAFGKFIGPFKVFGGVAVGFSIMALFFSLIFSAKVPQKRSEVMATVPWICGIAAGIGMISLIIGFVLSLMD